MQAQAPVKDEKERFYENLLYIADVLLRVLKQMPAPPLLPEIVQVIVANLSSKTPEEKKDIIEGYIKRSHMHWDHIRSRNTEYLVQNAATLFNEVPIDISGLLRTLLSGSNMHPSDLTRIWNTANGMVRICIRYIHVGRRPFSRYENGVLVTGYSNPSFFEAVNIKTEISKYPQTDISEYPKDHEITEYPENHKFVLSFE